MEYKARKSASRSTRNMDKKSFKFWRSRERKISTENSTIEKSKKSVGTTKHVAQKSFGKLK